MLHPVGSLPPSTYWKRRAVGLGVLLLILLVAILLVTRGGDDAPGTVPVGLQTPQLELVTPQNLSSAPAPTTASTAPAPASGATTTAAPTSAAPTSTAPASGAVAACGDDAVTLVAGSTRPSWAVVDQPVLTMTVTNVTEQPCTRDVGLSAQEWVLYQGETRLWGSNDCQDEPGTDVRTLAPGEPVTLQVQWSGQTSTPGCQSARAPLDPGDYGLVAILGGDRSDPVTLTFT